ncbi:AAA family ATPase [Sutcliffiella horikoshii]|uniref:AAA family ATPase n=1 Tax=Sutcliffiella horikoshii TaxID=79883 RepID=UPI00384C4B9B
MAEFQTLEEVAEELKRVNKKVTLLYAFNATGKTSLSLKFKELVNENSGENDEGPHKRVLYFNAFTEDLFYWDNDLENDTTRKLKMNLGSTFIELIKNQGKENEIAGRFQKYASTKIEPVFNLNSGEIAFDFATGDAHNSPNIKISRGEESIFIWSIFYILMETVIEELSMEVVERSTSEFDQLQYIFIDDPISSLDDNHAISVAIDLAKLIKDSDLEKNGIRFILTTHHALFYNVLYNELKMKSASKYTLLKSESIFELKPQSNDSPFGYHLVVKEELKRAISQNEVKRYHFTLLRNLLEKTATFLGYPKWSDCILEEENESYARIINLYSHNSHSEFEYKEPTPQEKKLLEFVFTKFTTNFRWKEGN